MDFKKLFRSFAVLAAVSLVSFSFTSCGDDEEEGGDTPADVQNPKSAMAFYEFGASQDMVDVLDITISYVDNGEIKTEKMTSTTWSATAKGDVLPATFGYKIHMKVKDNADFSKGSFDFITRTYSTQYAVYDKKGNRIDELSKTGSTMTESKVIGLKEEGVKKVFADKVYFNEGFEIGTDGKVTETTINW